MANWWDKYSEPVASGPAASGNWWDKYDAPDFSDVRSGVSSSAEPKRGGIDWGAIYRATNPIAEPVAQIYSLFGEGGQDNSQDVTNGLVADPNATFLDSAWRANKASMGPILSGRTKQMLAEVSDPIASLISSVPDSKIQAESVAPELSLNVNPNGNNAIPSAESISIPENVGMALMESARNQPLRNETLRSLQESGIAQARRGEAEHQQAIVDLQIPESGLERYAKLGAASAAPTLIGLGAGALTRSPAVGAAVSTALAAPSSYGEARDGGHSVGESLGYTAFSSGAELLSERLGFDALFGKLAKRIPAGKLATVIQAMEKSVPGRVVTGGLTEGATESLSQAAQNAYKIAALDEDMTFDEFMSDVRDSFGAGAVIGGPLAGGHAALEKVTNGQDKTDRIRALADQVSGFRSVTPESEAVDSGRDAARAIFAAAGTDSIDTGTSDVGVAPESMGDLDQQLAGLAPAPVAQQASAPIDREALLADLAEPELIRSGSRVFYRGDVPSMRARLAEAGLSEGMRKTNEDGTDAGLYFPARMQAEVDAVLRPNAGQAPVQVDAVADSAPETAAPMEVEQSPNIGTGIETKSNRNGEYLSVSNGEGTPEVRVSHSNTGVYSRLIFDSGKRSDTVLNKNGDFVDAKEIIRNANEFTGAENVAWTGSPESRQFIVEQKALSESLSDDYYRERMQIIKDLVTGQIDLSEASKRAAELGADKQEAPVASPAEDSVTQPEAVINATEAPTNNATPERIAEVPIASLTLSDDVPQFKSGAREDGVVEPLGGTFDRRGTGPIQIWRRKDGRMEVVSGRHRLDLARRSGEKTIPAQVYNESDGFDAQQAASLDAELNIRDGQGKVKDYVQYFAQPAFDGPSGKQAADARGLLARATGKRAYTIASQGDAELIAAHSADQITDEAAVQIAQAAPNNAPLQALGMKLVQEGKSITVAANAMRAVRSMQGDRPQNTADMFGFDDSAIQDAVKMANVAARKQREIAERLAAITGAAKRPEIARREGVDVRDPESLPKRIAELRAEKTTWDDWSTDPAKVAAIREELGMAPQPDFARAEDPAEFVDDVTAPMFSRGLRPRSEMESAPVGAWIDGGNVPGIGPTAFQVRDVPLDKISPVELDSVGDVGPEKRSDVGRYTEAMRRGEQFPNARGYELENGNIKLVDGHRRLLAAKAAGKTSLRIAVNPLDDSAKSAMFSRRTGGASGDNGVPDDAEVRELVEQYVDVDGAPSESEIREAVKQYRETESAYGGREAYDKAKAEGRTKLNFGQWVQVRTPNFKKWFGDWENDPANASKVVDPKTGEPLVVYHGTTRMFSEFSQKTAIGWGRGSYFTDNETQARQVYADGEGGRVVGAFLSIKKPFDNRIDAVPVFAELEATDAWKTIEGEYRDAEDAWIENGEFVGEALRELGYNGVIAESSNDIQGLEVVAFHPNQIKSATSNIGTFGKSGNILFSRRPGGASSDLFGGPSIDDTNRAPANARRAESADLFGGPTMAEQVAAAGRDKDAARNRGTRNDDGDGGLFDGPRPEQTVLRSQRKPDASGVEVSELSDAEAEQYLAEILSRQQAALDENADPLVEAFKIIAKGSGVFRNKLLAGRTMSELAPKAGVTYTGRSEDNGTPIHMFRVEQSNADPATAKIYDDGNDVWVDVSDLKSGGGAGERIYNMAFSFARNNGRNFIEDPSGLSDSAMYRRPVQQTAAMLKAGTAENIAPGDFLATQRPGGPKTRPIKAPANRDFDATLRENLLTVYSNAVTAVPEIAHVKFDAEQRQFIDRRTGEPVGDKAFDGLARNRRLEPVREAMVRVGNSAGGSSLAAAPVGGNTLKVAALIGTMRSAQPHERPAILAALRDVVRGGDVALARAGLKEILPSKKEKTPANAGVSVSGPALSLAQIQDAVRKAFGTAKILTRLINSGAVSLITKAQAIQRGLGNAQSLDGVKGLHDGTRGYLITDELQPNEVAGVLVHEIGVHHSMERILGAERFAKLQKAMESFRARGDKDVLAAYAAVPEDTPAHHVNHEAIAYLAEESPNHTITQRLVDGTKLFLNRLGIPLSWLKAEPAAIRKIARESLLAEARRGDGSVRYNGRDTLYQKVWHGTPHRGIEKTGFSLQKIGTGEGAQVYGWGMYFAKQRDIAEHYRKTLAEDNMSAPTLGFEFAGKQYDKMTAEGHALNLIKNGGKRAAMSTAKDMLADAKAGKPYTTERGKGVEHYQRLYDFVLAFEAAKASQIKVVRDKGQLYHAEIPEDSDLLDWDKPLSEQPEKVRVALAAADFNGDEVVSAWKRNGAWEHVRGEMLYKHLAGGMTRGAEAEGKHAAASKYLQSIGIPGLRYLDGNSRNAGEGSHNYVIWDEALLTPEKAQITPYYSKRVDGGDKSKEIVARGNGNPFYSAMLESAVAARGAPRKANAAAWKQWMDGAVRRGEFKQSERDWLGVDAWLDGRESTTREELADFIRANQVQVRDVVLGATGGVYPEGSYQSPITGEVQAMDDWMSDVPDATQEELENDLMDVSGEPVPAQENTKFANYQLPGGENYRELLLTLPEQAKKETWEWYDPDSGESKQGFDTQQEAYDDRPNIGAVVSKVEAKDSPQNYRSNHWDQPNILAHVRFNERTDADGNRVLFIEEIQSDWHQAGRKRGYSTGDKSAREQFDDYSEKLAKKYGLNPAHNLAMYATIKNMDRAEVDEYERLQSASIAAGLGGHVVPDAPFKGTDEWAMLAFKRMVRIAAEQGFDRIAWTTGEQQAERYDLSKQVDEIVVVPAKRNGHRFVTIKPLGESASISFHVDDEGVVYDGRDLDDKRLDEVLGKEMAERIMATEGKTTFDADGLKLGGEGMRAFYDKIMPSAVNKWAKRFGGKVGQTEFVTGKAFEPESQTEIDDGFMAHAIDLTDAMREAALAGQPLFSRRTPADAQKDAAARRAVAVNTLGGPTTGGAIGWNFDAGKWEGNSGTARRARAALDDKMLAWRDVQDSIAEHLGKTIPDAQNVYRLENLMHGRVKEGIDDLEHKMVEPLVRAMKERGITTEALEEYLYALHAKERNAYIASINPKMPDGGSGMTNAEADAILAKPLPPGMKEIAKRAKAIIRQTRQRLLDHGIITQDQFDAMESQYKNYVPLRGKRVGENEFGSGGGNAGRGIDGRAAPIKQAFGRGAGNRAENILGEIIGDAQRSIIAAEKARVGRAVMRIVLANPNPALWTVEPVQTERKMDANGEVYDAVVNDWSDPSIIAVRHRGKVYKVQINHAPLARALNLVGVDQIGAVTRAAGALNRYFSAVLTRYNPAFIPVNAARDALFGLTGLAVEHGEVTAMKAALYYPKAIRAAWREARRLPPKSEADTYAREFAEDGGKTGFVSMPSVEELQRKISNGRFGGYSPSGIAAAAKAVGDVVGVMNDAVENALRLSAYVQLRKQGMSREKAASYAKELTVNFNRKGEEGTRLNSWFLFYNASMQGIKRTGALMKSPKTWGYLGALTAAQIAAVMYAMGQEDDDGTPIWDKVPDHVKQRNLVFTWLDDGGEQKILTIPMPYGLNVFPYFAGRVADGMMHAENRPRDRAMSIAADTVSTAVQSFSPVPLDDGAMGLLPTALRIPLSIQVNRDDFGRQIRKENPFGKFDVPRASIGKPDTLEMFKVMATGLNRIGGGDERTPPPMSAFDVAPEDIEYVLEKLGGGTGKFIIDMATVGQKATGELPVEARDIPIAKRFFTNVNEPAAQQAMFYERREAIERDADMVRDVYEKDGPEAAIALLRSTPSLSGADFRRYKESDPKKGHRKGGIVLVEKRPQLVVRNPDSVYGRYKAAAGETSEINEAMRNAYADSPMSLRPSGERDKRLKELADKRMAAQRIFNAAWNRDVVGGE